ncbi:MAG TPA: pilus assembly protein PilM [Bacillota bacterium]|nr:pilus assembly protein PilM [Bacillota bacterium]
MFSFGNSKRVANIVIDDYVLRMVENNGKDLTSIKIVAEEALPRQVIEQGKIVDELAFYDFMKDIVHKWGIKRRKVRFYAPQALVIMRDIELPENVNQKEIKQYITMEVGHTIHFPFKNPVFDVYNVPKTEKVAKVTVLAAPEEEIIKYTEIFADVNLQPIAVDIQPLGIYRYFYNQLDNKHIDDVFMVIELNLTSMNISIFNNHQVEFLRYQPFNISTQDLEVTKENGTLQWSFTGDPTVLHGQIDDQINEIERLRNFYQFSLHQGDKTVNRLLLCGDYPNLEHIKEQLERRYSSLMIEQLNVQSLAQDSLTNAFIPALGLALKGGA